MTQKYYLWYVGVDDCASCHDTLEEAKAAANTGWQPRQHITRGKENRAEAIVWSNYSLLEFEFGCEPVLCAGCGHPVLPEYAGQLCDQCMDAGMTLSALDADSAGYPTW